MRVLTVELTGVDAHRVGAYHVRRVEVVAVIIVVALVIWWLTQPNRVGARAELVKRVVEEHAKASSMRFELLHHKIGGRYGHTYQVDLEAMTYTVTGFSEDFGSSPRSETFQLFRDAGGEWFERRDAEDLRESRLNAWLSGESHDLDDDPIDDDSCATDVERALYAELRKADEKRAALHEIGWRKIDVEHERMFYSHPRDLDRQLEALRRKSEVVDYTPRRHGTDLQVRCEAEEFDAVDKRVRQLMRELEAEVRRQRDAVEASVARASQESAAAGTGVRKKKRRKRQAK